MSTGACGYRPSRCRTTSVKKKSHHSRRNEASVCSNHQQSLSIIYSQTNFEKLNKGTDSVTRALQHQPRSVQCKIFEDQDDREQFFLTVVPDNYSISPMLAQHFVSRQSKKNPGISTWSDPSVYPLSARFDQYISLTPHRRSNRAEMSKAASTAERQKKLVD